MPKPIKNVTDIEIDEVSLVDKGANQHAMVEIAKRAPEEDPMPDLYNESGEVIDQDALELGDVVFDESGQAYEYVEADPEDEGAEENESEPAEVGKSAFFNSQSKVSKSGGLKDSLMEELSKAFSDEDRDKVIAKAFGQLDEMQTLINKQAEIAKSERDLRLTREYVSKASEYNLPVDPNELGPVLYRMAESMTYDDCAVIAKCLETAGTILFEETGYTGGGDNGDIMDAVNAAASERVEVGKSATSADVVGIFDDNPAAYDDYLAQRGL